MAPIIDRTTRIPSGVASPVTTNHAAKGSVSVNLRNGGNLKLAQGAVLVGDGLPRPISHTKRFASRFAKVDSRANPSTYFIYQ